MLGDPYTDIVLAVGCYVYILLVILASGRISSCLGVSLKSSRKMLHALNGNLPFAMPFFTASIYPTLVAAPFILITFIASPLFPSKSLSRRMSRLSEISEEGHRMGLVFYAISYTLLAMFAGSKPYVVAAGILPMAYGDSLASVVGEKLGRRKYKLLATKSLEGSLTMFLASLLSLVVSLVFFSTLYPFSLWEMIIPATAVALATTLVEGFSPMGSDNLTVPLVGALAFYLLIGGL